MSEGCRTDVHDGERTGRSSISGTVVNTERVEELIFENRRIVIPYLIGALRLSIGKGRARFARSQNFKLKLRWDKRISVFPEYNEK